MSLTEDYVRHIFSFVGEGDWKSFLENVHEDVSWTVVNPHIKSFPVAGVYDKQGFIDAIAPINKCFPQPLATKVQHIHIAQDNYAIVELRAQAIANDGMKFDNFYCWVCQFDNDKERRPKIKMVRAYLDSALVRNVMANNA